MDKNSRKGETSGNLENQGDSEKSNKTKDFPIYYRHENVGGVIDLASGNTENRISGASGPSSDTNQTAFDTNNEDPTEVRNLSMTSSRAHSFGSRSESEHQVETEERLESASSSMGPPPTYSFVMKQKQKITNPTPSDSFFADRPPPPTYSGIRGVYFPEEERTFNFPSYSEPIWRSHSQPALCPRCGIIILTTTHSHDSIATHVAALALCLFGCWPCCLLPYCMSVCKNTYHHCPICQAFLGSYTPW